tara:strand:- start:5251 stop:5724 length:474 start_codon:yes stop_codon:yes gene_type:complete
MPGSHFSSKRLRKALQTRSDPRMAGTVPRVGTPLATMRLLPRVEKNCGCHIPLPPPVDPIKYVTIAGVTIGSGTKIRDPNDFWGTNANPPFSFIHTYNVAVGDTIKYLDPTDNNAEKTVTVISLTYDANTGRPYVINTDNHGIGPDQTTTITIVDKS